MTKEILFVDDARKSMLMGIQKLASAVKLTIGPRGRNTLLERKFASPLITNDGVTIAKEIELENPFENIGASMIREVSIRTNEVAGDGTTTAIILAEIIANEGIRNITAGANPILLKRGMEKAKDCVLSMLDSMSKNAITKKEIREIANISASSEEIGELIARAIESVGDHGVIRVEEGNLDHTHLSFVEGMKFDRGYMSPYMVTNEEKMSAELENPYILITDRKISSIQEILGIIEPIAKEGKKLLIIAEDFENDAITALALNKLRGTFTSVCVRAPSFGDRRREILEDIAILTGGKVVSKESSMSFASVDSSILGQAKKVVIDRENTTIIEGFGGAADIEKRLSTIKYQKDISDSEFEKSNLEERMAKLSGKIAIINVGCPSELEMKEKKLRVEDALSATKSARESGVVVGGGVALLGCKSKVLELCTTLQGDERTGATIIARALESPLRQIAENSGEDGSVILQKIFESKQTNFGYDAMKNEFCNMLERGIIDPTKVTKTALVNAVSVTSTLLTTECIVVEKSPLKI